MRLFDCWPCESWAELIYGEEEPMKVKVKGGWKIRNHKTGKLWPKVYKTEEEVEKRLKQMAQYK